MPPVTRLHDFGDAMRMAKRFERGAENVRFMRTTMNQIADDMIRVTGIYHRSRGRRGGGSWKKLAPKTIEKKGDDQILRTEHANPGYSNIGNNALYNSLTTRGAPFQILNVTNKTVEYGTNRPYAGVHEHGSRKRNIPKRQLMKFTPRDLERWDSWMLAHMMRPFRQ